MKVSCTDRAITRPVEDAFLAAEATPIEDLRALDAEASARMHEIFDAFQTYVNTPTPQSLYRYAREPGVFANLVVQLMGLGIDRMQQILEIRDVVVRLETVLDWLRTGTIAEQSRI